MKITLREQCYIENPPKDLVKQAIADLSFDNPEYLEAKKYGRWTRGLEKKIYLFSLPSKYENRIVVPRGYLPHLEYYYSNLIESIEDRTVLPKIEPIKSKIVFRPEQKPWVNELLSQRYGIGVAFAGSGKTVMAMEAISRLSTKTLWLTHTGVLANQAVDRAKEFLEIDESRLGFIGEGTETIGDITVALVQTLIRRDLSDISDKFGLVIVDETQREPAETFLTIVNSLCPRYMYGLTATPYRRDGLEDLMYYTIGPVLTVLEKTASNKRVNVFYLPRPTWFQYSFPRDYSSGYDKITPVAYSKMLKKLIRDTNRNNLIANDVIKEALQGNVCVVLSGRLPHLHKLKALIGKDVPCEMIDGKTKQKTRREVFERLENSESLVLLATYKLLSEGFDMPILSRLFITFPMRDRTLVEQSCGRIERKAEGKECGVVYDYWDCNVGVLDYQHKQRVEIYKTNSILPWSTK